MSNEAESPRRSSSRALFVIAVFALILAATALYLASRSSRTARSAERSTLQKVAETKTVKACYIVYPPTVSAGGDPTKPTGFLIDVMNEIASRGGMSVSYEPTTFDDFAAALKVGKCDIIVAGIFENVARAKEMGFTHPLVYWAGVTAIAPASKVSAYSTLADLNKPSIRIAVTAGTAEHDFVKRACPAASIMPRADSDIGLTLAEVTAGRADVAFADAVTVRKFLRDKPQVLALFGGRQLNTFATCFVVRQEDLTWLNFLNASIDTMQTDGTIEALSRKHGGDELWVLPRRPWE